MNREGNSGRYAGAAEQLPLVLDARDVAELFGVTQRHALRLMARGELGPTHRVGGRLRVLRDELLRALRGEQ